MYQRYPALERPADDLFHDFMTAIPAPILDVLASGVRASRLANRTAKDQPWNKA